MLLDTYVQFIARFLKAVSERGFNMRFSIKALFNRFFARQETKESPPPPKKSMGYGYAGQGVINTTHAGLLGHETERFQFLAVHEGGNRFSVMKNYVKGKNENNLDERTEKSVEKTGLSAKDALEHIRSREAELLQTGQWQKSNAILYFLSTTLNTMVQDYNLAPSAPQPSL